MAKRKNYTISKIDKNKLPKHIAIIMDGNGRWAQKNGWKRTNGHKKGAETLKEIAKACGKLGVNILTVYAFSSENWTRPKDEVEFLMDLFIDYLTNFDKHLGDENIKVRFIGDIEGLPKRVIELIYQVQEKTINNFGIYLNIAVNYGSKAEIVSAFKKLFIDININKTSIESLNENSIEKYLYTNGLCDVDLLIRPGGEKRISNFLLWQSAYAELFFTDVLWPDFSEMDLLEAVYDFQSRDRRFGGV